ncbi:MAG: DNA repair protein RecO C-terminal domain-containing protein [Firmicutes bacterium]|nr:DNA repair protein RecO C-terminal domain-containing protein [Bacillota bacterium]MCM1401452.1 DNA repair protein RecO C-terminal domain-containing protein [Bacteroides sp.]MCM1476810.1 DNA repair protein RecO C-terminal domain-containing protein [Bacteroides sp.]
MKQTLHIIALRTIRHNEKHNIFIGYSLERGRVAMAVTAGSGKSASRLRALLMPLSVVECEADISPDREVHSMRSVHADAALHSIYSHPVKSAVAMFLAETLSGVLREGPPEPALWHFIASSIGRLNELPPARVANFHVCFLFGLSRCLGIAPDVAEYGPGRVFDLRDGRFRLSAPLHTNFVTGEEATAVWTLSRLTYRNMHLWHLTRNQRARLIDTELDYISMHYAPLPAIRSLDVLRSL